jgi:hypothetical protein
VKRLRIIVACGAIISGLIVLLVVNEKYCVYVLEYNNPQLP